MQKSTHSYQWIPLLGYEAILLLGGAKSNNLSLLVPGGRHGTEVAFALLTQLSRVRFLCKLLKDRIQSIFLREPAVLNLFGVSALGKSFYKIITSPYLFLATSCLRDGKHFWTLQGSNLQVTKAMPCDVPEESSLEGEYLTETGDTHGPFLPQDDWTRPAHSANIGLMDGGHGLLIHLNLAYPVK